MIDKTLTLNLLLATLGCFGLGGLAAIVTAGRASVSRMAGHTLALLGAVFAFGLGLAGLLGGVLHVIIPELLPVGGLELGLDRLSAFFVLVVAVGAAPTALYALSYTREYEGKHSLAHMGLALNVFLAAMILVVLARNILTFLFWWEVVSLTSYFLVMTASEREETQRAGWGYLVMTHAGTACLLIGFLLMVGASGALRFEAGPASAAKLDGITRHLIFILLALGFGSKAGVIPLHGWLSPAHSAAPSHISALMSGVMIKLGVYGLLRLGFDWFGVGPAWWGGIVLVAAVVSAVLGASYALVESDLKRLLACSSIENVGLILLGIGAGMVFRTYQLDMLAALALLAALYHTLNHTVFKSLLFMGAGAILQTTQTRNIEEMGGLIKRMPQTAVFFLTGSVAIAALPPLNGFISTWLTFQALLLSFQINDPTVNLIFALAVAALALTAGLVAAGFVKAFGMTFLALPRSEQAAQAQEVDWPMRLAMAILAAACLGLSLFSAGILAGLNRVAFDLTGSPAAGRFDWTVIGAQGAFATVSPLWLAVALAGLFVATWLGLRLMGAYTRQRYDETWDGGRALPTARFEYTAAAFSNSFKRVFNPFYRPVKQLGPEFQPEARFFVSTIIYQNETRSIIDETLYQPSVWLAQRLVRLAKRVQLGNVQSYLLYVLATLVALLALAK